ncbi:MAG: M15 family metallopeptidase [Clostridia bacterium]|nr:M15 family metallopeptidase [Clostridia bacterium]
MCLAVAVLILACAAFCGMTRVRDGGDVFSFRRTPRYQDDWRLALVNEDYAVPEGYVPTLLTLSNGQRVDERIYPDLQRMFDDARAAGLSLFVREGYRTREEQTQIMENKAREYLRAGYSEAQAREEAARTVAQPGHSEHELGLAVDINSHTAEDEWRLYGWLAENAWRYGFILRYPQGAEDVTGIDYEPWHYRYVGDAAWEIYEQGCTLEEYLCR